MQIRNLIGTLLRKYSLLIFPCIHVDNKIGIIKYVSEYITNKAKTCCKKLIN